MEFEEFQEDKCRPLWPLAGGDSCPVSECDMCVTCIYPTFNSFMSHWTGTHSSTTSTFQCGCGRRFRRQDRGHHHQKLCYHSVEKREEPNTNYINPQDYLPFRLVKSEEEREKGRRYVAHRVAEAAKEQTESIQSCDMVTRDRQAKIEVNGTEVSMSVDFKPNWLYRK